MVLVDFARYVNIAARQIRPLVERKPDSKESEMTLAVAQNVAKSHRKRYKSQEFNNANSYKLRSPKSVEN